MLCLVFTVVLFFFVTQCLCMIAFLIPRQYFPRNRRDGGEEGEDLGSLLCLIFSAKTHRLGKLSGSADKAVWRNVGLGRVTLYVHHS